MTMTLADQMPVSMLGLAPRVVPAATRPRSDYDHPLDCDPGRVRPVALRSSRVYAEGTPSYVRSREGDVPPFLVLSPAFRPGFAPRLASDTHTWVVVRQGYSAMLWSY